MIRHARFASIMAVGAVLLATACASAMPAPAVTAYACTPDGFTLQMVEAGGFRLTGKLDTPTPGYTVSLYPPTNSIHIVAPTGMALQVITPVDIDLLIPLSVADTTGRVEIEVVKAFGWGPDSIVCQPVVSTPQPQ